VFASAVQNVGLSPIVTGGGQLAECQNFLDNSADWGPIASAYVTLGGETTSQPITIQVIDANFPDTAAAGAGAQAANCSHPDADPSSAGFNGILGVGPHVTDCGSGCLNSSNFMYFKCPANGNCTSAIVPEGAPGSNLTLFQVSNPIAYMPNDNNGSALILPPLDAAGAAGANGYFVLGIGTNSNNKISSSSVTVIPANTLTNFTTVFLGHTYPGSFFDSGSNGLFFPQVSTNLPVDGAGFYNPTNITAFAASFNAANVQHSINFDILGSSAAFAPYSPNLAFDDLGGEYSGGFDWGLPFFFGRTVYIGIEGQPSTLGTGPFWAF
jgi:hypothetical protein